MSYTNMYATVSDNQGYCRSTSSQRGQVNSVSCWMNSVLGSVLNVSADYFEPWVRLPERKGLTLKEYRLQKEEALKAQEEAKKVHINIDIEENPHFVICINGVTISGEIVAALNKLKMAKFNRQLAMLTALRDSGKGEEMMALAKVMVKQ